MEPKVINMEIQEINQFTLSRAMTTKNCVYLAIRDTVALIIVKSESGEITGILEDIKKGSLFARGGSGTLHPSGSSFFMIGAQWGKIPNDDVMHYANPILAEEPNDTSPNDSFLK